LESVIVSLAWQLSLTIGIHTLWPCPSRPDRGSIRGLEYTTLQRAFPSPRRPKLCQKSGCRHTETGNPNGEYFGKVGNVSYQEAHRRFIQHIKSLGERRHRSYSSLTTLEFCRTADDKSLVRSCWTSSTTGHRISPRRAPPPLESRKC